MVMNEKMPLGDKGRQEGKRKNSFMSFHGRDLERSETEVRRSGQQ